MRYIITAIILALALSGCAAITASANKMEVIVVCTDGRVIQQTAHGGEAVRIFKETFRGCDDTVLIETPIQEAAPVEQPDFDEVLRP